MTPLAAAVLCLYATAAMAAAALARRDRGCRPVTAYLGAAVAIDLCRWGLRWAIPGATGPREGLELLGRHVEAGLYLAAILALPAMAAAVTSRRRLDVGAPIGAGLVLWAYVVAGYPELRGEPLMGLYRAVELLAVVGSLGCLALSLSSSEGRQRAAAAPVLATAALTGATGLSLLAPAWPVVVAANGLAAAYVLRLCLGALLRRAPA